ncbi:MAG: hypothetical protein A2015_00305 [Spirochaetes bacterium GWF1_31_7]|nr:MAG: hypothetical protein A2Y30_04205 [Spirochaetes bacterium GWE1_32_154]OHD45977.1 MAG: hypothetical protein A2Y29_07745 [Spirochaetes bacterium GWE2_31_10]OHD51030.1 MAG: hypothetical protein A2015_00305 [Spirochaetes bacterium GWF1_31_7]OHD77712.1 MAG: hypothetical protein A2355_03105 [Spirochaetes bacterium RIFOXYB1_FULL_32_8]HBD94347.1 hypothetical protein [Spirochaetia bacterium]
MNKVMCFVVLFFYLLSSQLFADDNDVFMGSFFQSVYTTVNLMNESYSKMAGIKSSGGVLKGSASTGNFPSFSIGTSISLLFFTNPFDFLKKLDISGYKIFNVMSQDGETNPINWLDAYFLPVPVPAYHFEVGLPKGFLIAGNFTFFSFSRDEIYKRIPLASLGVPSIPLQTFLSWGIGFRTGYTIMNSKAFLPCIAATVGFDFSEQKIIFDEYDIGKLSIGTSSINGNVSFNYLTQVPSLTTSLTISKLFIFFEPYFDMRFSQSFYYNATEFTLFLATEDMSVSDKNFFGDGIIRVGNISKDGRGVIIPVTEFTISTGFQFNLKGFRVGLGGSYAFVSRLLMASIDMRVQLGSEVFTKKKQKKDTIKSTVKESL